MLFIRRIKKLSSSLCPIHCLLLPVQTNFLSLPRPFGVIPDKWGERMASSWSHETMKPEVIKCFFLYSNGLYCFQFMFRERYPCDPKTYYLRIVCLFCYISCYTMHLTDLNNIGGDLHEPHFMCTCIQKQDVK